MAKKPVEKPRNGGQWTESKFRSFIVSTIRSSSSRWGPKQGAYRLASVGKKVNRFTGRLAEHFLCAGCKEEFPRSKVAADHILPVVDPHTGFTTWDEYIKRHYCEVDGFQILCETCHKEKTDEEAQIRKASKAKQKAKSNQTKEVLDDSE